MTHEGDTGGGLSALACRAGSTPQRPRCAVTVNVMPPEGSDELTVRRATPADRAAMIELCRASLGWKREDPNEEFFAWKHDRNPFGESPAWLAVAPDGTLAGLRVLMRWRFAAPDSGGIGGAGGGISAVRAVDTATHPDWQGKGIFRRLTMGALDELGAEGLGVVFNTPNDQSRPGYLKMGWSQVGRVPVAVRVRSPLAATHMAGARAAAEKWSRPCEAGLDAAEVFADDDATARLLQRAATPPGIATARTADYLRWRYSFAPLRYRALPLGDDLAGGVIVFRVRGRGSATELTVCEVLAPPGLRLGRAFGHLLRASGADYAIATAAVTAASAAVAAADAGRTWLRTGFVPAPRLGPILTWREVCRKGVPQMGELALNLGDVELF